jgi:hypothetical protein
MRPTLCAATSNVSDHLANERTISHGLGQVSPSSHWGYGGKIWLISEEIGPVAQSTASIHFSSVIGVALVVVGRMMGLMALRRFVRNQERIRARSYEPTALVETVFNIAFFLFAVFIANLPLTS